MLNGPENSTPAGSLQLLSQFSQGDEAAFKVLYDHYYLRIARFAQKFVADKTVTEDIVTDTFIKLWEKRSDFDDPAKLQSFLFTVTRNACLNHLRDEKRHATDHARLSTLVPDQSEPEFSEITEKVYEYLQVEISKLPPKFKGILQLHLQGLKNEEIAVELGIAEKTVRNLKVEAIKLLRIAALKDGLYGLVTLLLLSIRD